MELDRRALRAGIEPGDPGALAHRLDAHHQKQRVHFRRELAEAVDQLGREAFELHLRREPRKAAVETEAHIEIGHVLLGDQHRDPEVDLGRPLAVEIGEPLALARADARDRLLQHLLIKLVAHLAHLARLLLAEDVARTPDIEILAGQREARAEAVERAQDPQALFGRGRERHARLGGEIGIGAGFRAPHAAADLVELGEAEHVGAVDDHGVGGGDVEPALDDGGGQQHIVFAVVKGVHALIELARSHLRMGHHEGNLRHVFAQEFLDLGDVLHAGHHVEALPAPVMLAQERLADGDGIEFAHIGADGEAIDGGRGDHRKIAHARERHLQRARDRRGGEGEHMHVRAHFLQPLLVGNPEALLLVDHQQAEIAELHRFRQQSMGADHDIHRAIGDAGAGARGLGAAHEARKLRHVDREAAEALGEALVMLARQQRGGGDQRHLMAVHRRHEGRAHGDFRLAEAHIAADQAIHRPPGSEIGEHVLDGVELILGFLIGEPGGKFLPGVRGREELRGLAQRPLGGKADQALGHFAHPRLEARLLRLPGARAEAIEKPLLMAELRQKLDILHRQKEPVAARVFERQALMRRPHGGDGFKPGEAPHPVIHMHHQLAGAEALGLGEEILGPAPAPRGADQAIAEDVLLADDAELLPLRLEALLERPDGEMHAAGFARPRAFGDVAPIGDEARAIKPLIGQQPLKPLARALGKAGDDHLRPFALCLDMIGQLLEQVDVFLLALRCEIAPDAPARIDHPGAGGLGKRGEGKHPAALGGCLPGGVIEVEKPRRAGLVDAVEPGFGIHRLAARIILIGNAFPARKPGGIELIIEHHAGFGKVIEERFEALVEEGQPVFGALMLAPLADRLVKRIVAPGGAEFDAVVLAEAADRGLVEDDLAHRRKLHHIELFHRALAHRIEAARRIEHIAEEIEPDRPRPAGRVDIDDAAAHRVIARLGDGGGARKSHAREVIAQGGLVDPPAHLGDEGALAQHIARRQALGGGVEGGKEHEAPRHPAVRECGERGHAPGGNIRVGRDAIIGQAIPGRQIEHRQIGGEEGERGAHPLHALGIARDVNHPALPALLKLAQEKARVIALGRAGNGDAIVPAHVFAPAAPATAPGRIIRTPRARNSSPCPTWR